MDLGKLALPGVGLVLGGIGSLISAKSRRRDEAAKAMQDAKLARIDSEYAPLVGGTKGYKVEAPQFGAPTGASALAGGFSGALQGLNAYQGLQQQQQNTDYLQHLMDMDNRNQMMNFKGDYPTNAYGALGIRSRMNS